MLAALAVRVRVRGQGMLPGWRPFSSLFWAGTQTSRGDPAWPGWTPVAHVALRTVKGLVKPTRHWRDGPIRQQIKADVLLLSLELRFSDNIDISDSFLHGVIFPFLP